MQLVMRIEPAIGNPTWTIADEACPGAKDIHLNANDQILVLRASTKSSPKLRQPARRLEITGATAPVAAEEHVFVDDEWLDQFHDLCRKLPPQNLREIKEGLTELTSQEKAQLRLATQKRETSLKRTDCGGYLLTLSQGPTMPPLT